MAATDMLVDESYVVQKLRDFDNYRLKFYCHHVMCYGTDNGTFAFSFDVLVPYVKKSISELITFMYSRNITVPCSGIWKKMEGGSEEDDKGTLRSCFYATATGDSEQTATIKTHWRHTNKNVADENISITANYAGMSLVVWEI